MKKLMIAVFILLVILITYSYASEEIKKLLFEDVVEQTLKSCIKVEGHNIDGKTVSNGSAVAIGKNKIISCNHVFERYNSYKAITVDTNFKDSYMQEQKATINVKSDRDINIVYFDNDKKQPAVKIGDSSKVKIGQKVFAIGSDQYTVNNVTVGNISGIRTLNNGRQWLQFTCPAVPGFSGGGLFNENGELIGIIRAQMPSNPTMNFAVPIDEIKQFIKE